MFTSVIIECNIARSEVTTTLEHVEAQKCRDSEDNGIAIKVRRFPAHAACPVATARQLARFARREFPGAIVTLVGA